MNFFSIGNEKEDMKMMIMSQKSILLQRRLVLDYCKFLTTVFFLV